MSRARVGTGITWYPARDDDAGAETATAEFIEAFGRRPDGVWAAPGRVNLIGEHVDYNGGNCLPLALPHRAYVAMSRREDDQLRLRSAQVAGPSGWWQGSLEGVGPGAVQGWAGYVAGVPWALRAAGHAVGGVDAAFHSAVPLGSGLSSSASLECCVAIAVDELFGLGLGASDPGRARLAAACMRAENDIAAAPTGGMDQAASLRCAPGHALLLDCRDFGVEHIPLDPAADGLGLLVTDTRAPHSLVDGKYGSRRELCERAARMLGVTDLRELTDRLSAAGSGSVGVDDVELLAELDPLGSDERGRELHRAVRHVVSEIARVEVAATLLRAGRVSEIAPLLDASHASLRDDFEVSCPELDLAVETARDQGALGARMTGGGFGGSTIALVPSEAIESVAAAIDARFNTAGFEPPAFLRAVPSASASRVA